MLFSVSAIWLKYILCRSAIITTLPTIITTLPTIREYVKIEQVLCKRGGGSTRGDGG